MLKMLNHITGSETDTFDEVNKSLNILREKHNELVDVVIAMSTKNNAYNAKVDKYNKGLEEPEKKGDK